MKYTLKYVMLSALLKSTSIRQVIKLQNYKLAFCVVTVDNEHTKPSFKRKLRD